VRGIDAALCQITLTTCYFQFGTYDKIQTGVLQTEAAVNRVTL